MSINDTIIDLVDKLSKKMTLEEIHDFALELVEYVENLHDVDYKTESEEESESESEGEDEEIEPMLNDEGHFELKY
jgi:divalent metal cation (Fe/Co/Zn/Cd) transporter